MSIEKLDEVKLPYRPDLIKSGNSAQLEEYFRELIDVLQKTIDNVVEVVNYATEISYGDELYSQPKNNDGQYPLGTWRLKQDGDDWVREVLTDRDADTWTEAGRWEPA